MVRAVLFVAAMMFVVGGILIVIYHFTEREEEEKRRSRLKFDPRTQVYYDPEIMERTVQKNGVVSFKSKEGKDESD